MTLLETTPPISNWLYVGLPPSKTHIRSSLKLRNINNLIRRYSITSEAWCLRHFKTNMNLDRDYHLRLSMANCQLYARKEFTCIVTSSLKVNLIFRHCPGITLFDHRSIVCISYDFEKSGLIHWPNLFVVVIQLVVRSPSIILWQTYPFAADDTLQDMKSFNWTVFLQIMLAKVDERNNWLIIP